MELKINLERTGIKAETFKAYAPQIDSILGKLWSDKEDMTGWVKLPMKVNHDEMERILNTAVTVQEMCEEFIVLGVGGSYLGARAAIQAVVGPDEVRGTNVPSFTYPKVRFAGQNLSATYLREVLETVRTKETCICVISKSGDTLEPNIAFEILREAIEAKYKEKAHERIFVITDKEQGSLRAEAIEKGYTTFDVPANIGGRYSVLTAVGLLPMAVAGVDIRAMLAGAEACAVSPKWDIDAGYYATFRYEMLKAGKSMEMFEYYEPHLEFFGEWIKQLFAESEGKNGSGLYPDTLQFSADLHSIGQYLQEGKQMFFETVLNVERPHDDLFVPDCKNPLISGKSMNEINKAAMEGVMNAHEKAGIPIVKIDIPEVDSYYMGQLFYFFETSCAISAYMMEANPFDQPGVEAYKSEMKKLLK